MGDADELLFVTEGDDAMPVLKPDRARGPEARYADANKFIEENAAVRVASAFWHELKATPRHHLCGIIIPQAIVATTCARRARRNVGSSLDGNAVNSGRISGCGSSASPRAADGAAPANASNGVKADQKAFNLGF